MKIAIYIMLIAMAVLSGLFAVVRDIDTNKAKDNKAEGKSIAEAISTVSTNSINREFKSRMVAFAVYVVSCAMLLALYIIQG